MKQKQSLNKDSVLIEDSSDSHKSSPATTQKDGFYKLTGSYIHSELILGFENELSNNHFISIFQSDNRIRRREIIDKREEIDIDKHKYFAAATFSSIYEERESYEPITPLDKGKAALEEEIEDLILDGYEGQFVAYINRTRVGIWHDSNELFARVLIKYGREPTYVARISKKTYDWVIR